MKYLYLVRHAKSSWSFDLPDHDRPLGKRGRKDVLKMGAYLKEVQLIPEVLISSTASRAFYTALHLCDQMGISEKEIILSKQLFHASASEILTVVQNAPECSSLAIFGHNPGFTDCANLLANTNIDNVSTCGVVGITLEVDRWSEVDYGRGKQVFFYVPKEL